MSKWIPDTIPGVPARATLRAAPRAPRASAGASSGLGTTLRRRLAVATLVVDPDGRSSAVSVPLASVQTYRKNVRVWAATPVTVSRLRRRAAPADPQAGAVAGHDDLVGRRRGEIDHLHLKPVDRRMRRIVAQVHQPDAGPRGRRLQGREVAEQRRAHQHTANQQRQRGPAPRPIAAPDPPGQPHGRPKRAGPTEPPPSRHAPPNPQFSSRIIRVHAVPTPIYPSPNQHAQVASGTQLGYTPCVRSATRIPNGPRPPLPPSHPTCPSRRPQPPKTHPAAASPNIAPPPHLPHRPATHRTTLRIGPINPAHPHPSAPRSRPKSAPPQPIRHSGVRGEPALSLSKGNPVFVPRTPTPPKNTARRLKSFLEKTLTRATPPHSAPQTLRPLNRPATHRRTTPNLRLPLRGSRGPLPINPAQPLRFAAPDPGPKAPRRDPKTS